MIQRKKNEFFVVCVSPDFLLLFCEFFFFFLIETSFSEAPKITIKCEGEKNCSSWMFWGGFYLPVSRLYLRNFNKLRKFSEIESKKDISYAYKILEFHIFQNIINSVLYDRYWY